MYMYLLHQHVLVYLFILLSIDVYAVYVATGSIVHLEALASKNSSAQLSLARGREYTTFHFIVHVGGRRRSEHAVLVVMLLARACKHATLRYDVFSDKGFVY